MDNTNVFDVLEEDKPTRLRWADEFEEESPVHEETLKIPESTITKKVDDYLKTLKIIQLTHEGKTFDKTTGTTVTKQNTRYLKVVSKDTYNKLKILIEKHRPYKKDSHGKEVFDFKEQISKVKLTNELMNLCYRIDKKPIFIYSVVIIKIDEQNSLIKSGLYYDSKTGHVYRKKFEIVDMEHVYNEK